MDEKLFTELTIMSSAIAQQSTVTLLREQSKKIISTLTIKNQGVFVIAGLRGTGKTTILAQLYSQEKNSLFINAEVLLKHTVGLLDFLQYGITRGYATFLIDEIHAVSSWEKDIKIFYDATKKKIIISGSSAIALKAKSSELSRRAQTFELKPFSFREYLIFQTKKQFPLIDFKDLLQPQTRQKLEKEIQPYLHYFTPYLQFDALPAAFFDKNQETYINILERIIRYDLLSLREVDTLYLENTFRTIKIIASSPPGELSYSGLASSVGVGIKMLKQLISSLQQTGLIYLVPPYGTGKKAVRKEEKILMSLSFRAALCNHYNLTIPQGAMREDFFVQHTSDCRYLKSGKERRTPDFIVRNFIFEVGGPSKNTAQIRDLPNSYLVKESLSSSEKEIPLYLFGFLY